MASVEHNKAVDIHVDTSYDADGEELPTLTGFIDPLDGPAVSPTYEALLEEWKRNKAEAQETTKDQQKAVGAFLEQMKVSLETKVRQQTNWETFIESIEEENLQVAEKKQPNGPDHQSQLEVQTNWEAFIESIEQANSKGLSPRDDQDNASQLTPKDILDDLSSTSDKDSPLQRKTSRKQRKAKKREASPKQPLPLSPTKRERSQESLSRYIARKQAENARARSPRSTDLESVVESVEEEEREEDNNCKENDDKEPGTSLQNNKNEDRIMSERARVEQERRINNPLVADMFQQMDDDEASDADDEATDRYQVAGVETNENEDDYQSQDKAATSNCLDKRQAKVESKKERRVRSPLSIVRSMEERPERVVAPVLAEPTNTVSFAEDASLHTEEDLTFRSNNTTESRRAKAEQIKRELELFGGEDLRKMLPTISFPSPFNLLQGLLNSDSEDNSALLLEQTSSSLNILSDITSYTETADEEAEHSDNDYERGSFSAGGGVSVTRSPASKRKAFVADTPIDKMLDWFDGTTKSEEESFFDDERSDASMNRASTSNDLLKWLGGH